MRGEGEREKGAGEGGNMEEFEGRRGMVQPNEQHVAPCVKEVEWGLGTRGLRIVGAFSAGITQSRHSRPA